MKLDLLRTAFGPIVLFAVLLSASSAPAAEKLPFAPPSSPMELPETAIIETSQGAFEIRFFRTEAPVSVKNFHYLAKKGFYNKLSFHRYEPNFIIQGGDPLGSGKGGPGYTLPPEFSEIRHRKGMIGMARRPNEVNPERRSNGSQFYICLNNAPHLDGMYTIFAEVISGMDTVEKLRVGDQIIRIKFPKER